MGTCDIYSSEICCGAFRQDTISELSDYKFQSFELKRANVVAVMCRQGHRSQEDGDTSPEGEVCPMI
jgi:hypothetical protein